jgi:hypothetical protein
VRWNDRIRLILPDLVNLLHENCHQSHHVAYHIDLVKICCLFGYDIGEI